MIAITGGESMNSASSRIPEIHKASHFIGINSEGSVFNTMEDKHRKCFIPALAEVFELEHIQSLVEEVWTNLNLYSRQRGLNRFAAFVKTIEELHSHPVLKRFPGVLAAILPDVAPLKTWMEHTVTLSDESLEREIARQRQLLALIDHGRMEIAESIEELERCLRWSRRANELFEPYIQHSVAFNSAVNFLKMQRPLGKVAKDMSSVVVALSQGPREQISRQWQHNNIEEFVDAIHSQEDGHPVTLLKRYVREGGFSGHMLLVGDSPIDYEIAQAIGARFYPILPFHESESWERLSYEAWPIFSAGGYTLEYQNQLLSDFFLCVSGSGKMEKSYFKAI